MLVQKKSQPIQQLGKNQQHSKENPSIRNPKIHTLKTQPLTKTKSFNALGSFQKECEEDYQNEIMMVQQQQPLMNLDLNSRLIVNYLKNRHDQVFQRQDEKIMKLEKEIKYLKEQSMRDQLKFQEIDCQLTQIKGNIVGKQSEYNYLGSRQSLIDPKETSGFEGINDKLLMTQQSIKSSNKSNCQTQNSRSSKKKTSIKEKKPSLVQSQSCSTLHQQLKRNQWPVNKQSFSYQAHQPLEFKENANYKIVNPLQVCEIEDQIKEMNISPRQSITVFQDTSSLVSTNMNIMSQHKMYFTALNREDTKSDCDEFYSKTFSKQQNYLLSMNTNKQDNDYDNELNRNPAINEFCSPQIQQQKAFFRLNNEPIMNENQPFNPLTCIDSPQTGAFTLMQHHEKINGQRYKKMPKKENNQIVSNGVSNSSIMAGITPQEEALVNMNMYNPRSTKFINEKNRQNNQQRKILGEIKDPSTQQSNLITSTLQLNTNDKQPIIKQVYLQAYQTKPILELKEENNTTSNLDQTQSYTPNHITPHTFINEQQSSNKKSIDDDIEEFENASNGILNGDFNSSQSLNQQEESSNFNQSLPQNMTLSRAQSIGGYNRNSQELINKIPTNLKQSIIIECFKKIPAGGKRNGGDGCQKTGSNCGGQFILSKLETIQSQQAAAPYQLTSVSHDQHANHTYMVNNTNYIQYSNDNSIDEDQSYHQDQHQLQLHLDMQITQEIIKYCQEAIQQNTVLIQNQQQQITVDQIFKLSNALDTSESRYLVNISFWKKLSKRLKLKNKPLLISFNHTSHENQTVKVFLNSSNFITEEDSYEDDDYSSCEMKRRESGVNNRRISGINQESGLPLVNNLQLLENGHLKHTLKDGLDFVCLTQQVWERIKQSKYEFDIEIKQTIHEINAQQLL